MVSVMNTMSPVGTVKWKLKEYLEARGISAYKLATTVEERTQEASVYRLVRKGETQKRIDLASIAVVIDGLRELTGEAVNIEDILEYHPEPKRKGKK
jgi:hypothetical protein